jgi:hypothetical protein
VGGNARLVSRYSLSFDWRIPYMRGPDHRLYPLLRVGLQLPSLPLVIVTALIDTGAPVTIFDGRTALDAGMELAAVRAPDRQRVPLRGLTGGATSATVHAASIYVGDGSGHALLRTTIAFTDPAAAPLPFNVLGRRGFLDHVLMGLDDAGTQSLNREPSIYLRAL